VELIPEKSNAYVFRKCPIGCKLLPWQEIGSEAQLKMIGRRQHTVKSVRVAVNSMLTTDIPNCEDEEYEPPLNGTG